MADQAPEINAIKVIWSEQDQDVTLQFDKEKFRSWTFILGLLEMAKKNVEDTIRMQRLMVMQQQAAQQAAQMQAANGLAKKLKF